MKDAAGRQLGGGRSWVAQAGDNIGQVILVHHAHTGPQWIESMGHGNWAHQVIVTLGGGWCGRVCGPAADGGWC